METVKKLYLPENFFLGAAMSGPQTEGAWKLDGRLESLWDTWSQEHIEDFYNQVGSYVGNDMYRRFEEDFQILRDLGLTSVRTSIQWTRLLDVNGEINEAGVAFYRRLFAAAERCGLDCFVNLYHFDMPTYLFRRGGWESREVVEAFEHYAYVAFELFGDSIKHWFTFNEPIVEPEQRYQMGLWYPKIRNFTRARVVQYHISLAHSLAVRAFRELQQKYVVRSDARIGLISCFTPPYTKVDPSQEDLEAVRITDGLHNRWWLDLVTKGELPSDILNDFISARVNLPIRKEDALILSDGCVDWLGCNYYHPVRVQAPLHRIDTYGQPIFADPYEWPDAHMNESRGWEIYPQGIYDFGLKLRDEYPELEWFVSENGMGVQHEDGLRSHNGIIQDDYRVAFVREHLAWIIKAHTEGAKVRGYHYWAVIDNWSWSNAYKNRYGFVEVDLNNNFARRYKKSATWLQELARTRTIELKKGR